jgi:taurine dioxygenase
MRNSRLDVRPLSGAGGAEIFGVDVSQDLDDDTVREIRDALNEYCVVFFRDQELDVDRHKAFARKFGPIFIHPNYGMGDDPEVVMVRREPGDTGHIGEEWHTDTTMVAEPPMGSILYGIEVPPYGGDTLFANQYLAYEALSPAMKKMLEGLRAVHSDITEAGPLAGKKNQARSTKHRDDDTWQETRNLHPIVRTNRETGRRSLFVNGANTIGIEGMTDAESKPLLGFLLEHGHRPEFTFRFRWHKGSIAFWDNRTTKHIALGDTGPFRRLMRRIQIGGAGAPV